MQVLIAAATAAEIAPLRTYLSEEWSCSAPEQFSAGGLEVTLLTTGVGLLDAAVSLTRACTARVPDLLLLAGIGGAFDKHLPLGALVVVTHEAVGDLGAEDGDAFLTLPQLGLQAEEEAWIEARVPAIAHFRDLPRVRGITVNTVTGSIATEEKRIAAYGAAVESMEGAAAHKVAQVLDIPLLHFRAISNYTGRRDRASWKIGEAVGALNSTIISWLREERSSRLALS